MTFLCFSQLFDIDTTVDPSFVISLIRKLLPVNSGSEERGQSTEVRHNCDMHASNVDASSKGDPKSMDIGVNHRKESISQENNDKVSSCEKLSGSSVEEEAWEEHGCVLWDLAANETHAELMVILYTLN